MKRFFVLGAILTMFFACASDDMKIQEDRSDEKGDFIDNILETYRELTSYYDTKDSSGHRVRLELKKESGKHIAYLYHKDHVKNRFDSLASQHYSPLTEGSGRSGANDWTKSCPTWDSANALLRQCAFQGGTGVVYKNTGTWSINRWIVHCWFN